MKKLLFLWVSLFGGIVLSEGEVSAQTYTFVPEAAGCDSKWGTAACWSADTAECGDSSSPATPPTNPSSSDCEVHVVFTENATLLESNITLGGNFKSITLKSGADVNITGGLTLAGGSNINLVFEESHSNLTIGGTLTFQREAATLNVTGADRDPENEPITNFVTANRLVMGAMTELNVDGNAGVWIEGTTEVSHQTSGRERAIKINIDGQFYTRDMVVNGTTFLLFKVAVDAKVIVTDIGGTLEMKGNSTVEFIGDVYDGGPADGDSRVDIGGTINSTAGNENRAVILADDVTIYSCQKFPDSITKREDNNGDFKEEDCIQLSVVWLGTSASYLQAANAVRVDWATAKEWESSHFEIERATGNIKEFITIGSVESAGWSNGQTDYEFLDLNLPLFASKLYYRLKQVDKDGSLEYSNLITIEIQDGETSEMAWQVFPNPANTAAITLSLRRAGDLRDGPIRIKLISPSHRFKEYVVTELDQSFCIELSNALQGLPRGMIVLEINWQGRKEYHKILKQ
ncbi:hypothetical protein [Negadavirga shengliensis]|uniref:Uncharacterized protein n=1 Tax=Negadavirga shengliensis TaxID=1389218 RepID=A0ABV9SUR3_9BACT